MIDFQKQQDPGEKDPVMYIRPEGVGNDLKTIPEVQGTVTIDSAHSGPDKLKKPDSKFVN